MSHSWVSSVTLTPAKMTLSVEVTDVMNTTGNIEITGEATQDNGAWARISCETDIANATQGDQSDPEQKDRWFMDVEAVPTKDHSFDPNQDVTVFVRVSKVWVTVLGPGTDKPGLGTQVGSIWGTYKTDAQLNSQAGGGY